jgi:ribose 1,5-bisphosphokinase
VSLGKDAGTLVLVVGPSGAGKDTLIAAARRQLAGNGPFVFMRRIVTRASSAFEDHDTISNQQFEAAVASRSFALHWQAHGLSYGLGRELDTELAQGRIVVCNVSRGVIATARECYGHVAVVYVDARPDVRAARIAARGRDLASGSRSDESRDELKPGDCDVIIDNSGALDAAVAAFVSALRSFEDRQDDGGR